MTPSGRMAIGYGDEQQQQQLPKERHHQLRSVDNNMSDGRQTIVDNGEFGEQSLFIIVFSVPHFVWYQAF